LFVDILEKITKNRPKELIDNLHMRRNHWSLVFSLDVAAHDTRTNTFVEVQNAVLMDHVHVRANMNMQTMVTKEALVMDRKDRKLAHQNFRTLITSASRTAEDAKGVVAKVCSFMQNVTTPEIGKLITKQVSIALACLENIETKWSLCTCVTCATCLQYVTAQQKRAVASDKPILVFHMEMRVLEEDDESKVQHTSLGPEWDELHSTIPVVKYPRIITAQDQGNGIFWFICSCGFGARYQCVCRHIAMMLLHASDNSCAGCECENIALRNTAAFAACNDVSLIHRRAHDWRGIMCSHVTEESLRNCPSGDFDHDSNDGDNHAGEEQAAPRRTSSRQAEEDARWKQYRDTEMTKLQEHYNRVRSKLLSCKKEQFKERVAKVDAHLLQAFQDLGDVEDVAGTVVAHRYRDDPRRRTTPPPKRARTPVPAAAGGGVPAVTNEEVLIIDSSSSDDNVPIVTLAGKKATAPTLEGEDARGPHLARLRLCGGCQESNVETPLSSVSTCRRVSDESHAAHTPAHKTEII
jgi:hypothetical protein